MDKLLTPDQVADFLAVSRKTVYRIIKAGKLEAVNVESILRIPEESLKAYVNRNKKANIKERTKKNATAEDLLIFSGAWKGSKEEIKEIIKYIEESRTKAEF
jgi:excisionase family DNA binding protein